MRLYSSFLFNLTFDAGDRDITYNGKGFDQFRAVHTASYVDQNDLHQPLLTVKETLDFAARVQNVGHKVGEHQILCVMHTVSCMSRLP